MEYAGINIYKFIVLHSQPVLGCYCLRFTLVGGKGSGNKVQKSCVKFVAKVSCWLSVGSEISHSFWELSHQTVSVNHVLKQ